MLEAELPFQHISWCLLLKTHSDRTICKSLLYSARVRMKKCDCSQNNCSQTINVTICTLYIVVWVRHIVARELMVNEEMWWFVTPDRHTVQTSPQRLSHSHFAALDSFFNKHHLIPTPLYDISLKYSQQKTTDVMVLSTVGSDRRLWQCQHSLRSTGVRSADTRSS